MNEWQLYRASCTECIHYDSENDVCARNPLRNESCVCPRFALTPEADAARYVSAKTYARKIGLEYDASGVILRGKSRETKRIIRKLVYQNGHKEN